MAAVASNLAVGVAYFSLNGSVFATNQINVLVVILFPSCDFFFLHSGILILTFCKLKMFAVD